MKMIEGYMWSDVANDWVLVAVLGEVMYELVTGTTIIRLSTGEVIGLMNAEVKEP